MVEEREFGGKQVVGICKAQHPRFRGDKHVNAFPCSLNENVKLDLNIKLEEGCISFMIRLIGVDRWLCWFYLNRIPNSKMSVEFCGEMSCFFCLFFLN